MEHVLDFPRLRYLFDTVARNLHLVVDERGYTLHLIVDGKSTIDGDVIVRCQTYLDDYGDARLRLEVYDFDGNTNPIIDFDPWSEVAEDTLRALVQTAYRTWPRTAEYGGTRSLAEMAWELDVFVDSEYLDREKEGPHPARSLERYHAGRAFIRKILTGEQCEPALLRLVSTGLVALLDEEPDDEVLAEAWADGCPLN